MPFDRPGYAPNLPTSRSGYAPPRHGARLSGIPYDQGMDRPGFYRSSTEWVFENTPSETYMLPGGPVTLWRCEECGQQNTYAGLQVDHRTGWRQYLRMVRPHSSADAHDAYNDVDNLRLLCSTCNAANDHNRVDSEETEEEEEEVSEDGSFIEEDGPLPNDYRTFIRDWFNPLRPEPELPGRLDASPALDPPPVPSAWSGNDASRASSAVRASSAEDADGAAIHSLATGDRSTSAALGEVVADIEEAGEGIAEAALLL